jgi:hypothetical protein
MTIEVATQDANAPAFKETITFVESYQPPIKAGTYTLSVTQEITGFESVPDAETKQKTPIREEYTNTRKVYVAGERFSIDPSAIASVFPPDRNQGDHLNVLPHIVFSRRTLPWERKCGSDSPQRPNAPKTTPWLALLVFHDDDPIPPVQPAMVGDLFQGDFPPGLGKPSRKSTLSEVPGVLSYYDAYLKTLINTAPKPPEQWMEPGQNKWDSCLVVDVPVDLFNAIAPAKEDLGWLAHSREIKKQASVHPSTQGVDQEETAPGEYSVIIANRLPKAGGVSAAYLVSLEGMADFLPDPDGKESSQLAQAKFLRLVVLKAWSFSCTAKQETFRGYFDRLNSGPLQNPSATNAQEDQDDLVVKNALAMGYTALNHNTRWGDRTISWYRGPLVPFSSDMKVIVPMPDEPLSTADEVLRYDPELGMLDVSYAAAWQLGRLTAMREKSFAYALYQWKQEVARKTCHACHAARVSQLPHIQLLRGDGPLSVTAAAQALPTDEVSARAFQFLADTLADTLRGLDGREEAR